MIGRILLGAARENHNKLRRRGRSRSRRSRFDGMTAEQIGQYYGRQEHKPSYFGLFMLLGLVAFVIYALK